MWLKSKHRFHIWGVRRNILKLPLQRCEEGRFYSGPVQKNMVLEIIRGFKIYIMTKVVSIFIGLGNPWTYLLCLQADREGLLPIFPSSSRLSLTLLPCCSWGGRDNSPQQAAFQVVFWVVVGGKWGEKAILSRIQSLLFNKTETCI